MERMIKSFDMLLREQGFQDDNARSQLTVELIKAMSNSGYIGGVTGAPAADLTAERLENLDSTMTSVLFSQRHLKMWPVFPRVPSINPVFQWNRRIRYGGGRSQAGFAEGGFPVGGVSAYQRFVGQVRFIGVKGGVTHQVMTSGGLGGLQLDPVSEENNNRTLELLQKCEMMSMFGNAAVLDANGQVVNYDGFLTQMGAFQPGSGTVSAGNIMDLKGAALDPTTFEDVAERLITQAYVADIGEYATFMTPGIIGDLSKLRLGTGLTPTTTQRHEMSNGTGPVYDGLRMAGFDTDFGRIIFDYSIFLQRTRHNRPLLAANDIAEIAVADQGSPVAPAAPTMVAATDTTGKSTIPAGSYYYVASAMNANGESLGKVSAAAVSPTANQQVTVTIPAVAGATSYMLYRTSGNGGAGGVNILNQGTDDATGVNARWIAEVPAPIGGGNATYIDVNQWIPGTGCMVFIRPNVEDVVVAQMAPLFKYPLALLDTTAQFGLMLYHSLIVKAPERHFVIKNIGRFTSGTVFS